MRAVGRWLVLLGVTGALSGCATVSTGTSQSIKIGSTPDGAECVFTRDGETLQRMTTPGSITVKRSKRPITVVCVKEGYEEGRAVMNAQTEFGTLVGPGIVGGVVAAAALVDLSTGANNRYQTALMVELAPIGQADQSVPKPAPRTVTAAPPARVPTPATPAPTSRSAASAGPYDGTYVGSVEVLQTNVNPPIPHLRQFYIRVVNGAGTGTVKHVLCDQPGEVFFVIDTAGAIRGKANTRNTTGCTERMATLEGRMNGSEMTITLQLKGRPEFTMARASDSAGLPAAAVAMPAVSGPNDGDYGGGLELASGDLRQVWLRVVGTRGTGTVRYASCRNPGAISIALAADGSVTGTADLLNGPACAPKKATVKGRLSGKEMAISLVFEDGTASREFVFARRPKGTGVDD